jgi:hypothetical protein
MYQTTRRHISWRNDPNISHSWILGYGAMKFLFWRLWAQEYILAGTGGKTAGT